MAPKRLEEAEVVGFFMEILHFIVFYICFEEAPGPSHFERLSSDMRLHRRDAGT